MKKKTRVKKINSINRQSIYILISSSFLLFFVLVFSLKILIPHGKNYREQRSELSRTKADLRRWQNFDAHTFDALKTLQSENRHIISAFETSFNEERFIKTYKKLFNSLSLSKTSKLDNEVSFEVYEVKTSSLISSPETFYSFLDEVNKSDWIIAINFPINFKREGEVISSSFKMKVYCNGTSPKKDESTSGSQKK